MLLHFFHGSYFWFNYLVDIAILVGAFFTGTKWVETRRKKREKKKKENLQLIIRDGVIKSLSETLPDAVADELDATLDDAVDGAVKDLFGGMQRQLEFIVGQVGRNGGASLRDSQDRTETAVHDMATKMSTVATNQEVFRVMLENQQDQMDKSGKRQELNTVEITDLSISFAKHLGRHDEAARLTNLRASQEARHGVIVEAQRVKDETPPRVS